jgi:hypothetical protein
MNFNNDIDLEDELAIKSRLPKKIYIGFEKGNSAQDYKDVMSYIHSYAEDNFATKKDTFYKVKKIKDHEKLPDGHIFEIQEGGEKQSYLEGVLKVFEEKDDVILQTSEKQLFVQRNYDGISSYSLTENLKEKSEVDSIETDKSLVPLVKQGHVFMFTGIIIFSLSVISLFLAALFKYVLFAQTEQYIDTKSSTTIPVNRIINNWQSNIDYQTLSIQFNSKGNNWELHRKHYNYNKPEGEDFYKEGEIKYTTLKINNLTKLKKKVKENETKRNNIEKKKDKKKNKK